MRKRITAMLLAGAFIISLAGCGTMKNDAISATGDTAETVRTDETQQKEKDESTVMQAESAAEPETGENTESTAETGETEFLKQTDVPETAKTETGTKQPVNAESTPTQPPKQMESETPKQTENTAPAEESTKPPETAAAKPTAAEIEPLVAQYINEHRASQGTGSLTVLTGLTAVAEYRANQLITNFSHYSDPDACTVLRYGEFVDMTELGLDASANYYHGYDAEACAKGNWTGSAEDIAKRIADGFKNSSNHWKYLGSSEYSYMAVGLTYDTHTSKWYCCVCVSSQNYGS